MGRLAQTLGVTIASVSPPSPMKKSVTTNYRAVHEITPWRKVRQHLTLNNAVYGRNDGAPGLFDYRARIDYSKHGKPLYAVIWDDDSEFGFVIRRNNMSSDGTERVKVPTNVLLLYDKRKGATHADLANHFPHSAPDQHTLNQEISETEESGEDRVTDAKSFEEGAPFLEEHLTHERSKVVSDAKRSDVLQKTGKLECEVCGFEFFKTYGVLGQSFCEVHHLNQLSSRQKNEPTQLNQLAILCSNCHSMIHRTNPMWNVQQLFTHVNQIKPRSGDA